MDARRSAQRWFHLAALAVASIALAAALQPADATIATGSTMAVLCTCLPAPYDDGTVVWSGTYGYAFGGYNGMDMAAIYRIDVNAPSAVTDPHTLPAPRRLATAVWDPRSYPGCPAGCAYVIGGVQGSNNVYSDILRFDPASNSGTLPVVASLPNPRFQVAAAFDGTYVDIFGGFGAAPVVGAAPVYSDILRFDPMAPATPLNVGSLPTANGGAYAAWTGTQVLVIGGSATGNTALASVHAFTPPATVTANFGSLPYGVRSMAGVWDGTDAYIFGGFDGSGYHANTVRIPGVGGAGAVYNAPGANLPTPRSDMGGFIVNGCQAYVVGGESGPATSQFSNQVHVLGNCVPPSPPPPPPPPPPPVDDADAAFVHAQGDVCGTNPVQFTDTSQPGGAPIVAWYWGFGDGYDASAQNPSHAYATGGDFVVALTVTDAQGFATTTTMLVHVEAPVECPADVQPDEGPHPTGPPRDGTDDGLAGLDVDGDGVMDARDDCPTVADAAQTDADRDGQGDLCDPDRDGDGIADASDVCPDAPDPRQADRDRDGEGDPCDPDGDGVADGAENCPATPNVQADAHHDGVGEGCKPMLGATLPLQPVRGSAEREPTEVGVAAARNRQDAGAGLLAATGLMLGCIWLVVAMRRRAKDDERQPPPFLK
ncbi:MAG: thrombospondin type 3 repeat-containing protein [Thermoplasmatota archaeon]